MDPLAIPFEEPPTLTHDIINDRFNHVHLLADPVYGYIEITKPHPGEASEQDLLDTPWLQRLRRIHQLQSAWWTFPSAEHSRFVHLLGTMHLASLFARRITPSLHEAYPDAPSRACVEETLRLAGLLHDVGHGPFGHYFDHEVLSQWNLDHEDIGRHLIGHYLGELISSIRRSPNDPFEPGESIDPMWVSWVMADRDIPGYTPPNWLRALKPVLCGPATVDNLDYVPRDAHMCGVKLGPVDVTRLIHYSFVYDDTLVLHSHAVGALEMFLASRLYMYMQVYHHRTVRRFDLSMREIFRETISELMDGSPLERPSEYLRLTDWYLLESVQEWARSATGTKKKLGDQWMRIVNRDLPWHLAYENILHRDVNASAFTKKLLGELKATYPSLKIEVDVASAKIAPHNPMAEDGMVTIYDPMQGIERAKTTELVTRLPQYNQLIRVFTDTEKALEPLNRLTTKLLQDRRSVRS